MYTILSTSTTIGWLVLMIILLLIEIPTVGLTTIWGVKHGWSSNRSAIYRIFYRYCITVVLHKTVGVKAP